MISIVSVNLLVTHSQAHVDMPIVGYICCKYGNNYGKRINNLKVNKHLIVINVYLFYWWITIIFIFIMGIT